MGYNKADPVKARAIYFSIKTNDRTGQTYFCYPTSSSDPAKIERDYTNPETKVAGVAYERAFENLYGEIEAVFFTEKLLEKGRTLRSLNVKITPDDDGNERVISLPQDSRYADDLMKRLAKFDFKVPVRLSPFNFQKDGPRRVGISMFAMNPETEQFTEKIEADYFTKVEEKDGEKVYTHLHGFPEATDEDREDWEFFYKRVNKFLINYTKENILPKFTVQNKVDTVDALDELLDEPKDNINPDDIPF